MACGARVVAAVAMPLLRSSCVALTEFATDLTVLVPSDAKYAPRARTVLSSGGVADGVVLAAAAERGGGEVELHRRRRVARASRMCREI